MEMVLARREINRRTLDEYVLDEVEAFHILGPGRVPLHRTRREYTWYVRDGIHVRSPVRFNSAPVGEEARQRYESSWLARERERRDRRIKEDDRRGSDVKDGTAGREPRGAAAVEPRFVSQAYFLEFKFEPGHYYLAGRERLDGHDVLRVEYYPTRMFGGDDPDDGEVDAQARGRDEERAIERQLNKTALVTLWIDPAEHQIVKYTFDNVWLDFLPGAWLVRMDEIRASMTMGQPFPGVWLPRDMQVQAGVTLANGSYEFAYGRTFSEYRLAEVKTRIGPPRGAGAAHRSTPPGYGSAARRRVGSPAFSLAGFRPARARRAASLDFHLAGRQEGPAAAGDVVAEIRVHGNAFLSDDEVVALAGVAVGDPLPDGAVEAIAGRLRESRKFDAIDVRKRYRSLAGTGDVALVLVVNERPGVRPAAPEAGPGVPAPIARPVSRLRSRLLFLPILDYGDGYGFTYGARFSTVDLLGAGERLSTPLTWGASRRAAVELERPFRRGPFTRIESSVGIGSRENPRFDTRDRRFEIRGRAERVFADLLRADVSASRSTVAFGDLDDRLWTIGSSLALDTRLDPAFPANAVYLRAGWTGLHVASRRARINRYSTEARGYVRVAGQLVAAARAQYTGADASLPPFERLLPGGSPGIRGFRVDAFDGDRTLVTSAELRLPITSVLSGARFGVTAFFDAGKVWDYGKPMRDATWHRGAGGGIFLIASIVRLNLDVARALDTGRTRVHFSTGFAF